MFTKQSRPVREVDDVVTCFRDGVVTLRKNRRTTGFTESFQWSGYQGIRKGDLVIHVMDAFAGSIGVSDSDGKSTPVYSACTAKLDINNYYYAYLLREMARTGFIQSLYRGIRERSSDFRFEVFAGLLLPLPPRDEQDQIVRYLDWKVSQINKLINAKRRQIELLGEQKHITIKNAVRYTDGNKKCKVKNLAFFKSGTNLTALQIEEAGNYPVYGGNGLRGYYPDFSHSGEYLLIGRQGALCGNVHYVSGDFWATEHAVTVKPNDIVHIKWLYYLLTDINLNQYSMAAAQPGLSVEYLVNLPAYFPPYDEQQKIADFLDTQCANIDKIAAKLNEEITLFAEYRTRLISDVVTGKTDMRGVVVPGYESMEETVGNEEIYEEQGDETDAE